MKKFILMALALFAGMFNGAGAGKPVDAAVGKKKGFAGPASPLNISKKGKLSKGAKGNNKANDGRKKITGGGGKVNKSATKTAGKNANKVIDRANPKSGVKNSNRRK